MRKWHIRFNGRTIGAIGIFYTLPMIEVVADTREQAIEKARTVAYEKYEHLTLQFCMEVPS